MNWQLVQFDVPPDWITKKPDDIVDELPAIRESPQQMTEFGKWVHMISPTTGNWQLSEPAEITRVRVWPLQIPTAADVAFYAGIQWVQKALRTLPKFVENKEVDKVYMLLGKEPKASIAVINPDTTRIWVGLAGRLRK